MRSTISALIAVILLPVFMYGQTSGRAKYIGFEYEGVTPAASLPNGLKHMGGALLGDIEADPVYGISQVEKGRIKMLWLESSTGRNAPRRPGSRRSRHRRRRSASDGRTYSN